MGIEKPVVIVGAPRSGTTLLFSILSSHPHLWSLYRESGIIDRFLGPEKVGWDRGNVLSAQDASEQISTALISYFYRQAVNFQVLLPKLRSKIFTHRFREAITRKLFQVFFSPVLKPSQIRLVEKTPKNCLRIPFLSQIFPDAFFLHLTRDPRANISSLIEGWKEPNRYETYELPGKIEIKGYWGEKWNFLLPPEWEKYTHGKILAEVCAFQYRTANETALADLERVKPQNRFSISYEELVSHPTETIQSVCQAIDVGYSGGTKTWSETMPAVNTSSTPDFEKWHKNEQAVLSVIHQVETVAKQMGYRL